MIEEQQNQKVNLSDVLEYWLDELGIKHHTVKQIGKHWSAQTVEDQYTVPDKYRFQFIIKSSEIQLLIGTDTHFTGIQKGSNKFDVQEPDSFERMEKVLRDAGLPFDKCEARITIYEDLPGFSKFSMPLIRKTYPNLIASDLVKVQPMSQPSSLNFYINHRYSSNNTNNQVKKQ